MSVTEEIKSRLDIVNIIGANVQLKRTGKNYKGLCPFHDEKTPSFIVFPETQTWRCFGCGKGGDVFNYVMDREGWEFTDALKSLAEIAGVQLAPVTPRQQEIQEKTDRLYRILEDAADYFHRLLMESDEAGAARQYYENRGLSEETAAHFLVGYAPDSWDALTDYLLNLGHDKSDVEDSGLLVIRDDGRSYDRFRNRLIITIKDTRGRVIGFGARALEKDAQPKYLNSPQSKIFDKSRVLFGFSDARRSIRENDQAVIVEGYMDVMQAHQAGYMNVVAQMGTALTESQLNLLARYTNHLILSLDPDTAGQMATSRGREVIERVTKGAAEEAASEGVWNFDEAENEYRAKLTPEINPQGIVKYKTRTGFDIRVIILPEGKDPDLLIRDHPGEWARLTNEAIPIIDYVILKAIEGRNLDDPVVKTELADTIIPLINEISNPVERTHYRQYLARLLKVDERTFFPDRTVQRRDDRRSTWRKRAGPNQISHQRLAAGADTGVVSPTTNHSRETYCLAAIIQKPYMVYEFNRILGEIFSGEFYDYIEGTGWEILPDYLSTMLEPGDFSNAENRYIYEFWLQAISQDELDPIDYMIQNLEDETRMVLDDFVSKPLPTVGREGGLEDFSSSDDRIRERTLMTMLVLREMRIDSAMEEMKFLLGETEGAEDDSMLQRQIMLLMNARRRITDQQKAVSGRNREKMDN